jgi:hypothetical protein
MFEETTLYLVEMPLSDTQKNSEDASKASSEKSIVTVMAPITASVAPITAHVEATGSYRKISNKKITLSQFNSSQEEKTQESLTLTEKSIQVEKTPLTTVWGALPTQPKDKDGASPQKDATSKEQAATTKDLQNLKAKLNESRAKLAEEKKKKADEIEKLQEKTRERLAELAKKLEEKKAELAKELEEKKTELFGKCRKCIDKWSDEMGNLLKEAAGEDEFSQIELLMKKTEDMNIVDKVNLLDKMNFDTMTDVYKELETDAPDWMKEVFKSSQKSTSSSAPPPTKKAPPPTKKAPSSSSSSSSDYTHVTKKNQRKVGQETPSKCPMQQEVEFYRNEQGQLYHISKKDSTKGDKQIHLCGHKGHGRCKDTNCQEVHFCNNHHKNCKCHCAKLCDYDKRKSGSCRNGETCKFLHSSKWYDHPHQKQWPE